MTDGYYKCDRCGVFEKGPLNRNTLSSTDYSDETQRQFHFGFRYGKNDSGARSVTVDLCEDCRQALWGWINGYDDGDEQ